MTQDKENNYYHPQGYYVPNLKLERAGLSQNYQHIFENNVFILKRVGQGTQNGIEILVVQAVLSYGSK